MRMNMLIEKAREDDLPYIKEKVKKYWLDGRNISVEQFYVARNNGGKAVGFVRYVEYDDFREPCTLGVDYYWRGKGIAKVLFEFILREIGDVKPIFIITHIPKFFIKYGFVGVDNYPKEFDDKIKTVCKLSKDRITIMKLCK